ncbi:hypothetical protein RHMOL_Rhmol07G0241100 [Rhododendron molle]|uniref:Uncharacterized protein n=1 Tax=Rhododendron molle TaxID=49168 RepID=A0ACC0N443_RHOML|nr:hypothetical protein RHMOL_Rhmol07G0241100 [Rhododendron molle]
MREEKRISEHEKLHSFYLGLHLREKKENAFELETESKLVRLGKLQIQHQNFIYHSKAGSEAVRLNKKQTLG